MGYDGYFGASDTTQGYTGGGLSRSNAVRGMRGGEGGMGMIMGRVGGSGISFFSLLGGEERRVSEY
jgi:hypothetical protein